MKTKKYGEILIAILHISFIIAKIILESGLKGKRL